GGRGFGHRLRNGKRARLAGPAQRRGHGAGRRARGGPAVSVADRRAERARRQPPAVVLRHLGEPGTVTRDLCAGLEEEGVPVLLETSEPATAESRPAQAGAVAMAFAAAQ